MSDRGGRRVGGTAEKRRQDNLGVHVRGSGLYRLALRWRLRGSARATTADIKC